METLPRIFLSSTIYDLRDLRDNVETALRGQGYTVLASEDGTIPVDALKHSYESCLEAARNCDCLVAVIDGRFGGTMPGGKTSITQAEIDAALENGKQVYCFVRQAVWDAKEIYTAYSKAGVPFVATKIVDDERVLQLIDSIRKRSTGNWIFQFNRPSDLIATVLFQLQSFQASKIEASLPLRLKEVPEIKTVRLKDMSTTAAKRYSAFLLLGHNEDRTTVRQLVTKATEQLKMETYQKPGPMQELWANKPASVIWTYVGLSVDDIDHGNWLCRSLWIDPEISNSLFIHPLAGDESVNGIEFIWNPAYLANKEFIDANRVSKGEIIERVDRLLNALIGFASIAEKEFAALNANEIQESEFALKLQTHCEAVRNLYLRCSELPFGPPDTNEVVDLCGLIGGGVDELFASYSSSSMTNGTIIGRRVRFETAMATLRHDLQKLEIARQKLRNE